MNVTSRICALCKSAVWRGKDASVRLIVRPFTALFAALRTWHRCMQRLSRPKQILGTISIVVLIGVIANVAAMLIGKPFISHLGQWTLGPSIKLLLGKTLPGGYPSSATGDASLAALTIDYPAEGSVFPPDMTAPMFAWNDANRTSTVWQIDVVFTDGATAIHAESSGPPPQIGEIDPLCISTTNKLPELLPSETTAHTWRPDAKTWAAIQSHAVERPATVTITGYSDMGQPVSRGCMHIQVSKDPVDAPIFYRDVPLMPAETTPGVIAPLAPSAVPLINWRLRSVAEPSSRVILKDMPTCANCHSFSHDGRTLGMDFDGPQNNKSLYAITSIAPQMSIRKQDLISWNSFYQKPREKWRNANPRLGFMSQVSPDGEHVVTTLNSQVYVAHYKDYRFLQVFYPTRGILAWYSKTTGHIQTLHGADDPRYVHAGNAWSPDGSYLVFSRAEAKEAYPEGRPLAKYPNDPNEIPVLYDLYRIPFNAGKGGQAEPIAGASQNGMSNSFPKVSPDGRWIVFVQSRNGFLMRPDSQLYIVPAQGGQARKMRCNTSLMNSWHSFSPNGRWLVFSSKSRGPYTKMFLTHLDAEGNDTPAILIENSTAANRAVNIPEFLNIASDGLLAIDVPVAEVYRHFNRAFAETEKLFFSETEKNFQFEKARAELQKTLEIDPQFFEAHNSLGNLLARRGKLEEAIDHYQKALEIKPDFAEGHTNLGVALAGRGQFDEAINHYQKALEISPYDSQAYYNLGLAFTSLGKVDAAIEHYQQALKNKPDYAEAHDNLGNLLVGRGQVDEAVAHYQKALEIQPDYAQSHYNLGVVQVGRGQLDEAVVHFQKALEIHPDFVEAHSNLGVALARCGRFDEAIGHFQKVLDIRPDKAGASQNLAIAVARREKAVKALAERRDTLRLRADDADLLNDTAWMLATNPNASIRNGTEAVELAQRALQISGGKDPAILHTLAAAYAETGRFPEAVQTARKAQELATQQSKQALADSIQAKIRIYETGSAIREAPQSAPQSR
jgi:tetratricopeptide (TPR) repeat protein